jgi:hypothetical protein
MHSATSALTSTTVMRPFILMVISIVLSSCSDLGFAKSGQEGRGAAPEYDAATKQQKCTCLKDADRCIGIETAI